MKIYKHSELIRRTFLEYFIQKNGHTLIRSSPVVPFSDPTLSFVNAGMNQFKSALLGHQLPPCKNAANSQKCIRVGGKHNDLKAVGSDSYHHTFFEMLGNWSFGDYFKEKACRLSWEFLTSSPIYIPPEKLYVTYFSGDADLGLPPDLETRDVWLSLGVKPDRVLPFGMKENFWEMGKIGPCGPCTEIHYDYNGVAGRNVSDLVNRDHPEVIELWNIVFMEYKKNDDGILEDLAKCYVDTGMGLERLTAVHQGKKSNYDTDLFTPLFKVISHLTGARPYRGKFGSLDVDNLDRAYRILADHSRMCTVALADGMFPDQNQKLRRVIRRALTVAENEFGVEEGHELISELAKIVSDILSPTYPEIGTNLRKVEMIIRHEGELVKELQHSIAGEWKEIVEKEPRLASLTGLEAPAMPKAYRSLIDGLQPDSKVIPGDLALYLFDTHGVNADVIEDIAEALGLTFSVEDFEKELAKMKRDRMRLSMTQANLQPLLEEKCLKVLTDSGIPFTDHSLKYKYEREVTSAGEVRYLFPEVRTKISAVVVTGNEGSDVIPYGGLLKLIPGLEIAVVLKETCFYNEAGGQVSDKGVLSIICDNSKDLLFTVDVEEVLQFGGYILHCGKIQLFQQDLIGKELAVSGELSAVLNLDGERRLKLMCNHTATHIINAALNKRLTVIRQKSSLVTDEFLSYTFSTFGEKFNEKDVSKVEQMVCEAIESQLPIQRRSLPTRDVLSSGDVIIMPGQTYPEDNITLIQFSSNNLSSREACCGTHLLNSKDIGQFCITGFHRQGPLRTLKAVTGRLAEAAVSKGTEFLDMIAKLEDEAKRVASKATDQQLLRKLMEDTKRLKERLLSTGDTVNYTAMCDAFDALDSIAAELKKAARFTLRASMEDEVKSALVNLKENYFIHVLSDSEMDKIPLKKVTRLCPDKPVMIISHGNNLIRARCCIPKSHVDSLTAENWMKEVAEAVGGTEDVPRGQDSKLVCVLKGKRIVEGELEQMIDSAIKAAKKTANHSFS